MDLAFNSVNLRAMCEDEDLATAKLGQSLAGKLKTRLADLRACSNIKDIVVGNPAKLEASEDMKLDLAAHCHMVFRANHPTNPLNTLGEIEWKSVSRIKIMSIGSHV